MHSLRRVRARTIPDRSDRPSVSPQLWRDGGPIGVARPSTLLWYALPTPASADGKIEPGCNVRQAQAGTVLPSADVERGIDARVAALVGVTGAGPRIPITSRPCGPAVPKSVVLWHSHDCRISPPVCRGWPSVPTAQGVVIHVRATTISNISYK